MITALDDYPFGKLTERYDWVADNNSNWKIFADAFQEYYHVPSLHSQQVPSEVRDPGAGFDCGHFQLDGPHRLVSTAGPRRWLLPPEYMYPIERATRSGLVGPWRTPDIGRTAGRPQPRRHRALGDQQFPDLPQHRDPDLRRLVPALPLLADLAQHPPVRGLHRFHPARTVRERIEHEVASVVLKEFALQDAGMLGGTQAALEYGIVDDFPLNDQEILVRHLHKVVVDWVEALSAGTHARGGVTMSDTLLPSAFAELEPFAERWCLATETERWDARVSQHRCPSCRSSTTRSFRAWKKRSSTATSSPSTNCPTTRCTCCT